MSYGRQFLAPIHFMHEHRASPGPPTSWAREKLGPTYNEDLGLPLLLEPIASKDWKILFLIAEANCSLAAATDRA